MARNGTRSICSTHRILRSLPALGFLLCAACGSDDGGNPGANQPVAIRTLAYVVTECREGARRATARQRLVIRQDEREVTVREFSVGPIPSLGLCPLFAAGRHGPTSVVALPFQRLGVSPDGAVVVFEVTDDHSIMAPIFTHGLLPPAEEEGIFVVRSDGTGLQRLGPASREPSFRFVVDPSTPLGVGASPAPYFSFSPDGDRIAFTDLGPSPTGRDATQLMMLDLHSNTRTQVTHLPPLTPFATLSLPVGPPWFDDDQTLAFVTDSPPDGRKLLSVRVDGSGEVAERLPPGVIRGSTLVPQLTITRPATGILHAALPGNAVNEIPGSAPVILEIFVEHGKQILQLTNFRRQDTFRVLLDRDQERVLFLASADPFDTNPDENCQFFSVDTLGGNLRQLTHFGEGVHAIAGCAFSYTLGTGCFIGDVAVELRTGPDVLTFYSTCDPFGTNPNGGQFFTMQADGSGLRQLTHTRAVTTEADGTVTAELPGPYASPEGF